MNKRLNGKVAIITGAAQGMGACHARLFVEQGAKVIITDINEEKGIEFANELGENAIFVKHDVSNEQDWENVIEKAESAFGPINVLVNNAGISYSKPYELLTLEEYMRVININQVSVFLGMRAVLNSMRKAKGGSIINISSLAGVRGSLNNIPYSAAKHAVTGMTKTAALEFAKDNIRVNSVHPGMVKTAMFENTRGLPQEVFEAALNNIVNGIPFKRLAEPSEVSDLVTFLASEESKYCTGSEFLIDGGILASW